MRESQIHMCAATPLVVRFREEARERCRAAQNERKRTGVVMTMGALHEGHLSLVKACRASCNFTAVTLFVNPTQFGPHEDFERYPRQLEKDLELLRALAVDLVFAPAVSEIYRAGHTTFVEPPEIAHTLEGVCRPGHFRGVTTVVLKLFHILPVDEAFFGHKDYQQAKVIQRMAAELDLPVLIKICPTIREEDGLAMSSRNRYLSASERRQAVAISQALARAVEMVGQGEQHSGVVLSGMRQILANAGIYDIDYIAIADAESLRESSTIPPNAIALIAARVGKTRLIDNRVLNATNTAISP
jgi:pantoate--beta-alanine ligase